MEANNSLLKRSMARISLSALIAAGVLAGACLGMNLAEECNGSYCRYGWPMEVQVSGIRTRHLDYVPPEGHPGFVSYSYNNWNVTGLVFNCVLSVAIVLIGSAFVEYFVRRMDRVPVVPAVPAKETVKPPEDPNEPKK